ncbi:MAG TPA: prenyltransferase/squalene oxidase repeat-containing protein [Patescibacteria group bacterium]
MKKTLSIILLFLGIFALAGFSVSADSSITNALNYLKTNQSSAGQITGGSTGDASAWAAIAFAANGIDPTTVKNPTISLIDYLSSNIPTTSSSATEWEKWILAIVASNQNPYGFGGTNLVSTLESATYYTKNQLGDVTTATDDWFGVLSLISAGVDKNDAVLTNSLSFILSHQNTDGGFGYNITAGSDGNDTAAAIQALAEAQNYGVTNASLSAAITSAKTYLLTTQDKSGGFLYDTNPWTTAPDSDSTTWALMALNVLGMQSSTQATNAKQWLLTQQSNTDSGFTACNNWDANGNCIGYASNSTTTSHALIALAGDGWVIKTFDTATITPAPTGSLTPTPTPPIAPTSTPTPTPTPVVITNTVIVTPTPQPTQPSTTKTIYITKNIIITPTPEPQVLGAQTVKETTVEQVNPLKYILPTIFLTLSGILLGIFTWNTFLKKKLANVLSK